MARRTQVRESYHSDTLSLMRLRDAMSADTRPLPELPRAIEQANTLLSTMIELENNRIKKNVRTKIKAV